MSETQGASAPAAQTAQPQTQTTQNVQATATPNEGDNTPKKGVEQEADLSADDMQALAGDDSEAAQDVKNAQEKLNNASSAKEKKEAKKELEKAKHKYILKVDGQEEEWEGTEEDIKRELQLSKKARKEIQQSSELKKELAAFVELLKTNPKAVLADPNVGVDVIEFAKQILNEQIEEEMKSPEQKEKERLEKELEELRTAQKQAEEKRKAEEYERLVYEAEKDIEERVVEALDSSGLPKSGYTLRKMADIMLSALENEKEISPKQAANIAKREMLRDIKELFSSSNEDLLEELIGSDNIKRLNKRQLAKIKAKTVENANSIKEVARPKVDQTNIKPEKKVKISDWLSSKGR